MRTPRDFLSRRTETEDGYFLILQTPWPHIARKFVLYPAPFALCIKHQVETPGQKKQTAQDVFRHRRSLNASGIRYENPARAEFV